MAKWFCLIGGKQVGPIEPAKLKQLAEAGTLNSLDKVRREDMANWIKAERVQGLFSAGQPKAVSAHAAPVESRQIEAQNSSAQSRANVPPKIPIRSAPLDNGARYRTVAAPSPKKSNPPEANTATATNRIFFILVIVLGMAGCGVLGSIVAMMVGMNQNPVHPGNLPAHIDALSTIAKSDSGEAGKAPKGRNEEPPKSATVVTNQHESVSLSPTLPNKPTEENKGSDIARSDAKKPGPTTLIHPENDIVATKSSERWADRRSAVQADSEDGNNAVAKFLEIYRRLRKTPQVRLLKYKEIPNVEWRCFVFTGEDSLGRLTLLAHLPSSKSEELELQIQTADDAQADKFRDTVLARGGDPLEVTVRGEVIGYFSRSPATEYMPKQSPRVELVNSAVSVVQPDKLVGKRSTAHNQDVIAAKRFLADWRTVNAEDLDGGSWANSQLEKAGYSTESAVPCRWRCVLHHCTDWVYAEFCNAEPTDPIVGINVKNTDTVKHLVGETVFDQWSTSYHRGIETKPLALPPVEAIVEGKFGGLDVSGRRPKACLWDGTIILIKPKGEVVTQENSTQSLHIEKPNPESHTSSSNPDGHSSTISSGAFSPNGHQALTGSWDNTAILWDVETGEQLRTFRGHIGGVYSVAFSPDGRRILTGSGDKTAILWDVNTGQNLKTLQRHTKSVESVGFSHDGRRILTGSRDYTAILWDAASGEGLQTYLMGGDPIQVVFSVAFSPDDHEVLTGTSNHVYLWNTISGEKLRTFEEPSRPATFSPDGRQIIASISRPGHHYCAGLLDVSTGNTLNTFEGHTDSIWSAAFSPDGRRVATASFDKTAIIWDVLNATRIHTLTGNAAVYSVAFSPDGRRVLTGAFDATAILWDVKSGEKVRTFGKAKIPK